MKNIILTIVLLSIGLTNLNAQGVERLRSFGFSFNGGLLHTMPKLNVAGKPFDRSKFSLLMPLQKLSRQDKGSWHAFGQDESSDLPARSYLGGLGLFYSASTRKYNINTFEVGFNQLKLVHSYELQQPFYLTRGERVEKMYNWYYLNEVYAQMKLERKFISRSVFWYFKLGATYSWVGKKNLGNSISKLLGVKIDENAYDGVKETGPLYWGDASTNSLFLDNQLSTKKVYGAILGTGFSIRLGRARQHALYGGVSIHQSFKPVMTTYHGYSKQGPVLINEQHLYNNAYFAYEFGIKLSLFRAKGRSSKQQYGYIQVNIEPSGAIANGAKWRIVGEQKWRNPGEKVHVKGSPQQIEFKDIAQFDTPPPQYIHISGKLTTLDAKYELYTNSNRGNNLKKRIGKEAKNCFNLSKVPNVKPAEIIIKSPKDKVEIEFFADKDDGDKISVCIDGKMILDNKEVTSMGMKKQFKINASGESYIIIRFESSGGDKRVKVKMDAVGINNKKVTLSKKVGQYYWLKIVKVQ